MIELLRGELCHKDPQKMIIMCAGVGYAVAISSFTYNNLKAVGEIETVHTILRVREDDMSLFGFIDLREKQIFELLGSVSGIGAKTAMTLLSAISFDKIFQSVITEDSTLLSSAPGIGAKTAKKIILELKDKFLKLPNFTSVAGPRQTGNSSILNEDAINALVTLGYKAQDAATVVVKLIKIHGSLSTQEIITLALKDRMK